MPPNVLCKAIKNYNMRVSIQITFIFYFISAINPLIAQQTNVYPQEMIPNTEVRFIHSSFVGDDFKISIAFPSDYFSSDSSYAVLYLTDANSGFAGVTQMLRILQWNDEVPKMLIVGIGYSSDSLSGILRSRDYTPTIIPDSMSHHLPTGGASKFVSFIKEELMPFIRKNYRASSDASYAGVSYGGLLGLYILFHEPSIFQRYIIVSPSVWFDNRITLKYAEEYAHAHTYLNAKVFMCVGELEETETGLHGYNMVSNMKLLSNQMLNRHYQNFNLQTHIFSGDTHYSISFPGYSMGLRAIFRK